VLRQRSAYGALVFAAFSVFWTSVAFLLSRPPFGYNEAVIGLFGLVGAAGWTGVCPLGAAYATAAFALWLTERRRPHSF